MAKNKRWRGIDVNGKGEIVFTKENPLIEQILELAGQFKIRAYRINNEGWWDEKDKCYKQHAFAVKGIPDILGYMPDGKIFACECKTVRDRASIEQIAFIDDVNTCNGIGLFAKSIEDLLNKLVEKNYVSYDGVSYCPIY